MTKLLVVHNNSKALGHLAKIARDFDAEVISAKSAKEALRQINLHNFDVIVTDLKMETATAGFSVLRAAKAKDVTTQVIVLTAYGKPEVKAESMVLGAFDYLETSRSDEKTTIGGIFEVIRDKISSALCFRAKLAASTVLPQDEVGNG